MNAVFLKQSTAEGLKNEQPHLRYPAKTENDFSRLLYGEYAS